MPIFEVVSKKVIFFEKVCELIVKIFPRFAYKANQDLELGFETTLKLISTSQIQWQS